MKTTFEVYNTVTFKSVFYPTFAEAIHAARRLQAYGFTAYLRTITTRSYNGNYEKNQVTLGFDEDPLRFSGRYTMKWNEKCGKFIYYVSGSRHM